MTATTDSNAITTTDPIASLSLACRITLNLHSLNNEGGEGNQIQTRFVDIVVDGTTGRRNVNAISGDMLRHIVGEKLLRAAEQRQLPISAPARRLDANRINADEEAMERIQGMATDAEALDYVLRRCAVSEMMGVLITGGKRALPRTSVLECGWAVGVPDQVSTDSFFHAKYQADRGSQEARQEARQRQAQSEQARRDARRRQAEDEVDTSGEGTNLGQVIFHRPASSGVYALVCHLELGRIGLNDITQRYALSMEERTERARALVEATLFALMDLQGAMRAAQLPHLTAIQGIVTTSSGAVPAPLISPLAGGMDGDVYRKQAARIAKTLNGLANSTLQQATFDDAAEFAEVLGTIARGVIPAALVPAPGV